MRLQTWCTQISECLRDVRQSLHDGVPSATTDAAVAALRLHAPRPPAPWDTPRALADPVLRRWWVQLAAPIELLSPEEAPDTLWPALTPYQRVVLVYDAVAERAMANRLRANPQWIGHPELEQWLTHQVTAPDGPPLKLGRHHLPTLLRSSLLALVADPIESSRLGPQQAQTLEHTVIAPVPAFPLQTGELARLAPALQILRTTTPVSLQQWLTAQRPASPTPVSSHEAAGHADDTFVWRHAMMATMFAHPLKSPAAAGWDALLRDRISGTAPWSAEETHALWDGCLRWWPREDSGGFNSQSHKYRTQWNEWRTQWTTQWPREDFAPGGPLWGRWCELIAHVYQHALQQGEWAGDLDLTPDWARVVSPEAVPAVLDLLVAMEAHVAPLRARMLQRGGPCVPTTTEVAQFLRALPAAPIPAAALKPWLQHADHGIRLWAIGQMERIHRTSPNDDGRLGQDLVSTQEPPAAEAPAASVSRPAPAPPSARQAPRRRRTP